MAHDTRQRLAAGTEELVPSGIRQPHPRRRESRPRLAHLPRLSARDLAGATDLSASYISEIESGKKEGSLSAMKKIARCLRSTWTTSPEEPGSLRLGLPFRLYVASHRNAGGDDFPRALTPHLTSVNNDHDATVRYVCSEVIFVARQKNCPRRLGAGGGRSRVEGMGFSGGLPSDADENS